MNNTNQPSGTADGTREEPPQPTQIAESFAVPGEVTLVVQYANPDSGMHRSFIEHCIAGRKYLRPLGLGAGVPVLSCHQESESKRIARRRYLISQRDPCATTRKRANANIRDYVLQRKDRVDRSLLTREGQHALWSELDPKTQAVFIDSLEAFTATAGKDAAKVAATASLSELLERLAARGIAIVIFAKAPGRNKMEPPPWMDGFKCNMVYVEEDRKNPIQGGARLTFCRNAIDELDRAPRVFTWWWTVDENHKLDFSCREEHFVEPLSPKQQARHDRLDSIKMLIAEGITQQKEIAIRLGVDPATIFRDSEELVRRGEIIKDPKTGALSLPDEKAALAGGTEGSRNDDDESVEEW